MNTQECIENALLAENPARYLLGCDEVGRGPLAGPVTTACVSFPIDLGPDFELFQKLDDSKKLTATQREELVPMIEQTAAAWAVVDISPEEIDRINILQASLLGMKTAAMQVIEKLQKKNLVITRHEVTQKSLFEKALPETEIPDVFVAVDGNKTLPGFIFSQCAYVKGDARSWNIAAASILAKVHRDELMKEYDALYPGYGFAHNAGYPTKEHREAILKLGFTPIHRKSFRVRL